MSEYKGSIREFMDSISAEEHEMLSWLHKRCDMVVGNGKCPTTRTARAMAERCSAVAITKHWSEKVDPRQAVLTLRGLADKGLVKEYEIDGLPCFIPVSRANVEVYSMRELTQDDIGRL